MDLTTATPTEIDEQIAAVESRRHDELAKLPAIERRRKALRRTGRVGQADQQRDAELVAQAEQIRQAAEAIGAERAPYDEEFTRRDGWTRFFIVEHLHTSIRCPSFRPGTRIGWLPQYSGCSTEEMIAAAGEMICTRCVPAAPVAGKRPEIAELAEQWDAKQQAADQTCPGSGTSDWQDGKVRTGYMSGNGGACGHCGRRVGNTSRDSRVIRKHKK